MNIFVLDDTPEKSARCQIDKHVVKMPLESAQMLCSALHRHGIDDAPYKATHQNHPCTVWAGDNVSNFLWLVRHGLALCFEYSSRYEKTHKCQPIIGWCAAQSYKLPDGSLTDHALAMPDAYKSHSAIESYRKYYMMEKLHIATWKQNKPDWWRP